MHDSQGIPDADAARRQMVERNQNAWRGDAAQADALADPEAPARQRWQEVTERHASPSTSAPVDLIDLDEVIVKSNARAQADLASTLFSTERSDCSCSRPTPVRHDVGGDVRSGIVRRLGPLPYRDPAHPNGTRIEHVRSFEPGLVADLSAGVPVRAGHLGREIGRTSNARVEDDVLRVDLNLTEHVDRGAELSLGYAVDLMPDNEQRITKVVEVAVVDRGRCGPVCRVDGADQREDAMPDVDAARRAMVRRNQNAWRGDDATHEDRADAGRDDGIPDAAAARRRMIERNQNAWQGDATREDGADAASGRAAPFGPIRFTAERSPGTDMVMLTPTPDVARALAR